MERERRSYFASQEGRFPLAHSIEALPPALSRAETFGRCHNCGEEIAFDRLDALCRTRATAIACKQRRRGRKARDVMESAHDGPEVDAADRRLVFWLPPRWSFSPIVATKAAAVSSAGPWCRADLGSVPGGWTWSTTQAPHSVSASAHHRGRFSSPSRSCVWRCSSISTGTTPRGTRCACSRSGWSRVAAIGNLSTVCAAGRRSRFI